MYVPSSYNTFRPTYFTYYTYGTYFCLQHSTVYNFKDFVAGGSLPHCSAWRTIRARTPLHIFVVRFFKLHSLTHTLKQSPKNILLVKVLYREWKATYGSTKPCLWYFKTYINRFLHNHFLEFLWPVSQFLM